MSSSPPGFVLFANVWIRIDCIVSVYRQPDLHEIQVSWCAYSDGSDHYPSSQDQEEDPVVPASPAAVVSQTPRGEALDATAVTNGDDDQESSSKLLLTGQVHTVHWSVSAGLLDLVDRAMADLLAKIHPFQISLSRVATDASTRHNPFLQCGQHLVFHTHHLTSLTRNGHIVTVHLSHALDAPLATFHWPLVSIVGAQYAMQSLLRAVESSFSSSPSPNNNNTPVCVLYGARHGEESM